MLSRSGLYALQAALHLALRPPEECVSAARMAKALELPPDYLAKVLRRLAQEGVLTAKRGVRGGYALTTAPDQLTIARVVAPFDETEPPSACLLGGACNPERPCAAHRRRLEWNEARRTIFSRTSLSDLLPPPTTNGNPAPADAPASIEKRTMIHEQL